MTKGVEEQTDYRLMRVTPELFDQFLAAKGVANRCISCGSSQFSAPMRQRNLVELLPSNFDALPSDEQAVVAEECVRNFVAYVSLNEPMRMPASGARNDYYMMHCRNCGHLSLYRASVVLDWLDNNCRGGDNERGD